MSNLTTIETKLMAAVGPDRELDGAIAIELGWKRHPLEKTHFFDPAGKYHRGAPRYTSSIDAALTLLPEDTVWKAETDYGGLRRASVSHHSGPYGGETQSDAATTALAICLAAIKWRRLAEPLPTAITRPTKATKANPGDEGER